MKPSQAAQSLADAICAKIAGSICYGIDDETNVEIARLIDEHHASMLVHCQSVIESVNDPLTFSTTVGRENVLLRAQSLDAALKPWAEPAE